MKTILALATLVSFTNALWLLPRDDCSENNCNRAVSQHPIAECKSFFSVTIVPSAKTKTTTITSYSIPGNNKFRPIPTLTERDIPPGTITATDLPAYASATCTSAAAYSSACSCAGAKHGTTTAKVNPITVTATKTVTVSSFKVQGSSAAMRPDKQYLRPDMVATSLNYLGHFFSNKNPNDPATIFTMTTSYLTTYTGLLSQQDMGATSQWIWADTAANIALNGWQYVDFLIDPFTLEMSAKSAEMRSSVLQVCFYKDTKIPYLALAAVAGTPEQNNGEPCFPITLEAIPA